MNVQYQALEEEEKRRSETRLLRSSFKACAVRRKGNNGLQIQSSAIRLLGERAIMRIDKYIGRRYCKAKELIIYE